MGTIISHPCFGAHFALILAFPSQVIAAGELHFRVHLLNRLSYSVAERAAAHAVLDSDIALVVLAVDFGSFVGLVNRAELRERNSLPGGREQADVLDGFAGAPVLGQVAEGQIVDFFAAQHLGKGVPADRGLHSILNIGNVDAPPRGFLPVDCNVEIGLSGDLENAEIGDAADATHHSLDLCGFIFELVQVAAIDLGGEFAFHATDRLLHVVFNGL